MGFSGTTSNYLYDYMNTPESYVSSVTDDMFQYDVGSRAPMYSDLYLHAIMNVEFYRSYLTQLYTAKKDLSLLPGVNKWGGGGGEC